MALAHRIYTVCSCVVANGGLTILTLKSLVIKRKSWHTLKYSWNRQLYLFRKTKQKQKNGLSGTDNHGSHLSGWVRSLEGDICQYLSHFLGQNRRMAPPKHKRPGNTITSHWKIGNGTNEVHTMDLPKSRRLIGIKYIPTIDIKCYWKG